MQIKKEPFFPSFDSLESRLGEKFAGVERAKILLYSCIVVYAAVFSILTVLRHYAFRTQAWDLGIFTQSLWTTAHGEGLFYHTPELIINPSGSFFGVHFSPVLFLVLPLYWLFPFPETLLVLQSFLLASAAIPIYLLARKFVGSRVSGLFFAVAYLVYPATSFVNLYDFHVQAFLPVLLGFMLYYLLSESWPKYFAFMFLALMVEEHAAQIFFFVGIYIAWRYRRSVISGIRKRRLEKSILIALTVILISIVWYWFTIWQRNTFFPTNPAALDLFLSGDNFKILGARNPLEIPILVALKPLNAVQALTYDGWLKLSYLVNVFGPLAFSSFISPSMLLPTVPWFGFSLLSQATVHHTLGFHYESYVTSFVFGASIVAVANAYSKKPTFKTVARSLKAIGIITIIFFVATSPLSPVVNFLSPGSLAVTPDRHGALLGETVAMVPADASILTQNNIFPHVSNRPNAYVVPDPWINTAIHDIVVDFVNRTIDNVDYILVDSKTDLGATSLVLSLLATKTSFTLISSQDNGTILLYRRAD